MHSITVKKTIVVCVFFAVLMSAVFSFMSFGSPLKVAVDMNQRDTIQLINPSDTSFIIDKRIDLQGHRLIVPENCTLVFKKGRIVNGIVQGSNTRLIGEKNLFENVIITGTWIVPFISTNFFVKTKNGNELSNAISLAHKDVDNLIHIPKGSYWAVATNERPYVLSIPSNTKLKIEGTIKLRPNSLNKYAVLDINKSKNVAIYGGGEIRGDRANHYGKEGEWGMCIMIRDSRDVSINNIQLAYPWGDCIYIGQSCENILINSCVLEKGRRQGISITGGNRIKVENCIIKGIKGTIPGYAIDIEPNSKCRVSNVFVKNVKALRCTGGFALYKKTNDESRSVDHIEFDNCYINSTDEFAFSVKGVNDIAVNNCEINNHKGKIAYRIEDATLVSIHQNTIATKHFVFSDTTNVVLINNRIKKGVFVSSKR